MKSVGEVMAIGRTFQESLQKALRGLEIGADGLNEVIDLRRDEADRSNRQLSDAAARSASGMWATPSAPA